MLSVNQLAASIKLIEAWKSCNSEGYPIQLEKNHDNLAPNDKITRPHITRVWKEDDKNVAAKDSFFRSTAKLGNQAPWELKTASTLTIAKKLVLYKLFHSIIDQIISH